MKASVVVPVYNPGSSIERCIASVLDQSMPPDEYEVIFVDDGSTDETPARLDALAAMHPRVSVIHTPNSGWAGRPRNVGIDAARGRFVQLLDQDDELTREALERLVAMGDRNGSDIVIGKEASDFRPVSLSVFARNRERCSLADAPLIESLTPHKMFRTAFLRAHGLRFAEERRRLEDQLFVVQAYFRARTVSILADHVCYRYLRREDGRNAGKSIPDPASYYGNLREVMDVVVANTSPGAFRDTLLRRFVRKEVLSRATDRGFATLAPAMQARRFEAMRGIVLDFAGPGLEAGLEPLQQAALQVIRAGSSAGLVELAQRTAAITASAGIESAAWRAATLELRLRCELRDPSGDPLAVVRSGDRWLLDPALLGDLLDGPLDVTEAIDRARLAVSIRAVGSGDGLPLWAVTRLGPAEPGVAPGAASRPLTLQVTATLDPVAASAGRAIPPGRWVVEARLMAVGIDRRLTVQAPDDPATWATVAPGLLGRDPVAVQPAVVANGAAAIDVLRGPGAVEAILADGQVELGPTDGRRLDALLRVATTPGTPDIPVVVVAGLPGGNVRVPAMLTSGPDGLRLHAELRLGASDAGAASLGVAATPEGPVLLDLGRAEVGPDGRTWPESASRTTGPSMKLGDIRQRARRARWRLAIAGQRVALTARLSRAALRQMRRARGRSWRAMVLSAPRIRPWR